MKKKSTEQQRTDNTAVAVATPMPPLQLETPQAATPAEAVRFDLDMARKCASLSLAYVARAGWRLACEKQGQSHGAWYDWCEKNLGISHSTVDRYIKFYYATVGEYIHALGTGRRLVDDLTDKLIEEATVGLKSQTATGAMIELGVVKPPPNWGGDRREKAAENGHVVGRPKKKDADVAAGAAPLAESDVDGELCAEEGRDLLSKLAGWALGADDGFGTLPDRELANAVETLEKMLKRAKEIRDAREAGR